VLLISTGGQAIRVGLKDIPTLGRTTQGVRIMRMREGDKVASLGLMPEQEKTKEWQRSK
jgi:DNA gyrase subunit A